MPVWNNIPKYQHCQIHHKTQDIENIVFVASSQAAAGSGTSYRQLHQTEKLRDRYHILDKPCS
jgi:hypothetical protein